jgi:hypothetical protein
VLGSVKGIGKDQPTEQMAFLRFRKELALSLGSPVEKKAYEEKLKSLVEGPEEQRAVSQQIPASDGAEEIAIVVSPVKDFAAFIRKIDFAEVLFSDVETRVVILGPLKKK